MLRFTINSQHRIDASAILAHADDGSFSPHYAYVRTHAKERLWLLWR
jgi:hypothetical protein